MNFNIRSTWGLFFILYVLQVSASVPLVVVDTAGDPAYNNNMLITLLRHANCNARYAHLYSPMQLDDADAVCVIVTHQFLTHKDSRIVEQHMQSLKNFCAQPNKICILLFDALPKDHLQLYKDFILTLFPAASQTPLDIILETFSGKKYANPRWYDTTLTDKTEEWQPVEIPDNPDITWLPHQHTLFSPQAAHIVVPELKSNLYIAKHHILCPHELEENFWIDPSDTSLRLKLLQSSLATFQDIMNAHASKLPYKISPHWYQQCKDRAKTHRSTSNKNHYSWIEENALRAAWLDVPPFLKQWYSFHNPVSSIKEAGFNLLWLICNPEEFFSPQAAIRPHEGQKFLHELQQFTQQIYEEYPDKKYPHVVIGFDITNNYRLKPVNDHVVDVFETHYEHVPAPLDDTFWQTELIIPFDAVTEYWDNNCTVPWAGVFFDMEMYHAPKEASSYTNTMDFSDTAWRVYTHDKPALQNYSCKERIEFLHKHALFEDYFTCLTQKAHSIGKRIREHVRAKNPNAMIGLYYANLPGTWFTQGFLAGLSTPEDPIIFFTFNNDFFNHYEWLVQHDIYCFHASALLLSKFKTTADFSHINAIMPRHDGIWFNKFSRLLQSRNKKKWEWDWGLETSPLPRRVVAHHINHHMQQTREHL